MIRAILKLPWYYVRRRMIASWTIDFTGFSEDDLDDDAAGIVIGKMHARKPSRVLKLQGNEGTYRASVSPDEALAPLFALRFFRHCDLLGAEPNLAEEAAELLFDLSVAGFQSTLDPAMPKPSLSTASEWSPSYAVFASTVLSDECSQSLASGVINSTVFPDAEKDAAPKGARGFTTSLVEVPMKGRAARLDVSNRGDDAGRTIFLALALLGLAEASIDRAHIATSDNTILALLFVATARCTRVITDEATVNDGVIAILKSEAPDQTAETLMIAAPDIFLGSKLEAALECLHANTLKT